MMVATDRTSMNMRLRMTTIRVALGATILSIASLVCAQPPTGTTTLVYDFSRGGFRLAEMTDTLKVEGTEYHLISNATGVGVVALLARRQSIRRERRRA